MTTPAKPKREPAWLTVPAGTKAVPCKGAEQGGKCAMPVYWIAHPRTGRPHPVDCIAVDGSVLPSAHAHGTEQGDLLSDTFEPARDGRGVSHWATCLDAARFRSPR